MANDRPCLHLPLDELRVVAAIAAAPNVGGIGADALVRGNPKILHDPTMGTCMRFDGDGDYIELTDLASLTFAEGMTAMAWVRFEETAYFSRIFDLNVAPNQRSHILWAGNEERTQHLAFEIDGVRFRVENGVALRQWRHLAFVYDPAGRVSVISDGVRLFSQEVKFDLANRAWQTGYLGRSSWTADGHFRGAMAHFRLYNQALSPAEVKDLMISDQSAMAYYRETTLLKVELYTVRDDDHKPILYVEAANKGEPLELSLTNPGDKPVTFKPFDAPTADDFHVQLRFRRNVIAPNLLQALQSDKSVAVEGWRHVAGTTADGREDYLSLVKSDASLTLGKGEAWRIQIPNFSAAAQGGARNTRVQVRYRTEPQDPGSVTRHMEVQSHLGLKTIPLIARFRDSNTLLNDGQTGNKLTIEVVCTSDTGSVRLDTDSQFELIIDDELLAIAENGQLKSVSSLGAVSNVGEAAAKPVAPGTRHKTIAFQVKRPEVVDHQHPLTFELSNWVTNKPSGMYNILLRYENVPGYWDGAWVLPVQFSPLLLRSDKIGIGTNEPSADLEIRRDVQGAVGSVLKLNNFGGGAGAGGAIDFNGYNVGKETIKAADGTVVGEKWHDPAFRIQSVDDGNYRSDLVFSGKKEGNAASELEEKVRITAEGRVGIGTAKPAAALDVAGDAHISGNAQVAGRIKDKTGFVMPVGAILPYGGNSAPEGWLLCNGQYLPADHPHYGELRNVVGDHVPDLRSRFIVGAGQGRGNRDSDPQLTSYPLYGRGGEETVTLTVEEMPSHNHTVNPDGYHQFKQENIHYDGSPSWGAEDRIVFMPGDEKSKRFKDFIRPAGGHKDNDEVWSGTTQPHKNLPPYYALTYIIKY
jgi:microcystin-dependent protein